MLLIREENSNGKLCRKHGKVAGITGFLGTEGFDVSDKSWLKWIMRTGHLRRWKEVIRGVGSCWTSLAAAATLDDAVVYKTRAISLLE